MDVRENKAQTEKLLRALVKQMKTQTAVARALGCSRQRFNYWFNHANEVPYEQLLALKALLVQEKSVDVERKPMPSSTCISQRLAQAAICETCLGKRQGQRSDIKSQVILPNQLHQLCPRWDEVAKNPALTCNVRGRTDALVASHIGMSRNTYLRAKKVVQTGNLALIEAMDNSKLTIAEAAALTKRPIQEQNALLANPQALRDYLKSTGAG